MVVILGSFLIFTIYFDNKTHLVPNLLINSFVLSLLIKKYSRYVRRRSQTRAVIVRLRVSTHWVLRVSRAGSVHRRPLLYRGSWPVAGFSTPLSPASALGYSSLLPLTGLVCPIKGQKSKIYIRIIYKYYIKTYLTFNYLVNR